MSHANLSRRAIPAGAASVPALALPAVVAAATIPAVAADPLPGLFLQGDDPVIALAGRAIDLHDEFEAAAEALLPSDGVMCEWRQKNPQPKRPEPPDLELSGSPFTGLVLRMPREQMAARQEASEAQQAAAIKRWERRERDARRRTGYRAAYVRQSRLCHQAADAAWALSKAVPCTLAGLAAKVRAIRTQFSIEQPKQLVEAFKNKYYAV
jgi:hypothetical protein